MEILDRNQTDARLAKALGKPILHVAFPWLWDMDFKGDVKPFEELWKAAPYLKSDRHDLTQAVIEGQVTIICDSDEERDRLFDLTVGDDGPTKLNPYDGPMRVYALTISADGEFLNENT